MNNLIVVCVKSVVTFEHCPHYGNPAWCLNTGIEDLLLVETTVIYLLTRTTSYTRKVPTTFVYRQHVTLTLCCYTVIATLRLYARTVTTLHNNAISCTRTASNRPARESANLDLLEITIKYNNPHNPNSPMLTPNSPNNPTTTTMITNTTTMYGMISPD